MNPALSTALLAALTLSAGIAAQTKPDFSGTWTMDATRSQSPVQNEPVRAITLVIRHSTTAVSIESTRDGRSQTVTYRPGSPESMAPSAGRTGLLASIFYWDGVKLVTEAVSDVNGMTVRHKAIHALDAGGTEMSVELLTVVEHGYSLRGTQNYGSLKDVFKKVGQ